MSDQSKQNFKHSYQNSPENIQFNDLSNAFHQHWHSLLIGTETDFKGRTQTARSPVNMAVMKEVGDSLSPCFA